MDPIWTQLRLISTCVTGRQFTGCFNAYPSLIHKKPRPLTDDINTDKPRHGHRSAIDVPASGFAPKLRLNHTFGAGEEITVLVVRDEFSISGWDSYRETEVYPPLILAVAALQ
jgi:hypothetical protein